ncbi:auxin-induced 5NG4-like protein, partial [Trifolium medium]|nr:auxin-induced 5NG4-like protein [Trifolium medium]
GPVFVAVYQPVQTLVVAIMASLALGEEFYLGGLELTQPTMASYWIWIACTSHAFSEDPTV